VGQCPLVRRQAGGACHRGLAQLRLEPRELAIEFAAALARGRAQPQQVQAGRIEAVPARGRDDFVDALGPRVGVEHQLRESLEHVLRRNLRAAAEIGRRRRGDRQPARGEFFPPRITVEHGFEARDVHAETLLDRHVDRLERVHRPQVIEGLHPERRIVRERLVHETASIAAA
jgi:hypothetical protein